MCPLLLGLPHPIPVPASRPAPGAKLGFRCCQQLPTSCYFYPQWFPYVTATLSAHPLLKHHLSPSPYLLLLTHLAPVSIKPPEPILQRPTMTIQQTFYSHLYVLSQEDWTWFSIPCLLTHFLHWLSGTPHFPCYHQFFSHFFFIRSSNSGPHSSS